MAGSLEALGRDGWSSTGTESVRFGHRLMDRGPAGRVPCGAVHHEGPDIFFAGDIRLDNRKDLAAELGLGSTEVRIISDSGLVATAYERWGLDCPSHLLGDFAFAIWDQKQRRLFWPETTSVSGPCSTRPPDRVFASPLPSGDYFPFPKYRVISIRSWSRGTCWPQVTQEARPCTSRFIRSSRVTAS